ncbi:hypothetical protein S40285_02453 [Stachybotrys chlorohalonatus IBT 40285]|uniref:Major facilitator superfamily (MFS) profile domain-containing protein n=1 Tax=Stachybotrys chlorohalonatus (strain IBT 40285) TaxID=1283841 RepID=A0A084R0Q8_STAC4|nr:hypothetical protein S40285_02453 [Stachybotrys chlorohalonata IBT 40285]
MRLLFPIKERKTALVGAKYPHTVEMAHSFEKDKETVEVTFDYVEPKKLADVVPNYGKYWWHVPHLRRLNLILLVPIVTTYVPGYDGSMFNGMQSMTPWREEFGYPAGPKLGLLATVQTIGSIASMPIAPYVSDRFGRRWPIFVGSIIVVVGAIVQCMATSTGMFAGARALVGFGTGIATTSGAPLMAELAYPTHRAISTAVYTTFWYLGSMVAAWAAYGTYHLDSSWSWRLPPLVQAIPSVFQILFIFLVPESPRWLLANGQSERAERELAYWHGGSTKPTKLVEYELEEIKAALRNEVAQKTSSYRHFITTPGNRYRLFITICLGLIVQWCGNGVATYYLTPILDHMGIHDPATQNLISSALQTFNYFVAVGSSFVIDRVGRRPLLLASMAGMCLSLIAWTAISAVNEEQAHAQRGLGIGIIVMIFIYFFFYNMALNPVPMSYLLEVLPFTLRAKGVTLYSQTQFFSSVFFGFINPIAMEAIEWKYYIVFACLTCGWFFIIWRYFPETQGRTLEDVAEIFDGKSGMELERQSSRSEVSSEVTLG